MKQIIVVFFLLMSLNCFGETVKKANYAQWELDDLEKYMIDQWWITIDSPTGLRTTGTLILSKNHRWSFKGYAVYDTGTWDTTLQKDGQYRIYMRYEGSRPAWAGGSGSYLIFADSTNTMIWSVEGHLQILQRIRKR